MSSPTDDDHDGYDSGGDEQLVVEFAVPTDAFVLGRTLDAAPGVTIEFEQFAPTRPDPLPYLWTTGGDRGAFERAVAADPTVERVDRVSTFDVGALYRVEWADPDDGLLGWLRSHDATLLQSESLDGEWLLKLRVPTRAVLGELQEFCEANAVTFRLIRLFSLTDPKMGQFNVSRKQRETLVAALEMGYFEVPRGATLGEVADALGVSTNSASERLRRAQTNLVSNTVTVGQPTGIGVGRGDDSGGPPTNAEHE